MVFKKTECRKINQAQYFLGLILLYYILLIPIPTNAITREELQSAGNEYDFAMAIVFDKKKKKYSTISVSKGLENYTIENKNKTVVLSSFKNNQTVFSISTYPEFLEIYDSKMQAITLFNSLPETINLYMKMLDLAPFNLNVEFIIIPDKYRVYYETEKRSVSDEVNLIFVDGVGLDETQLKNVDKSIIGLLPHELFHFFVDYFKLGRLNELRNETYAHLFGKCVAYEINPMIIANLDVLEFPDSFYKDPAQDLKKVRKKVKKENVLTTRFGGIISLYYFQAVANHRTGQNISSSRIPKFCHKLFSEGDFKHPIEKKPPPWFKDFLENNEKTSS